MSDRRKWAPVALALVVSALLTWGVQYLVVANGIARLQARINERAVHLADIRGKAMALGAMTSVSTDPVIRATAQGLLPPDNPQVMAKLGYLRSRLDLDNSIVLSADGMVKAYSVDRGIASLTGTSLGWRPYFTGAMAGMPTVYAALGSNSRARGFYVAVPVPAVASNESREAAPVGVVVAKLGFDEIDSFLGIEPIPAAVVSPEGIVFASNVPEWRYAVLGNPAQLEEAKSNRRVSKAYEKKPPELLEVQANGRVEDDGRSLRLISAPIAWPDPSGIWRMVGFVDPLAIFSWPERLGTAAILFVVLMLIHAWLQARQRALRRTRQVVNLLDNSGEGFLAFGPDLVVDTECSRACESMLGMSPAGRNIADLLCGDDAAQAELMRETIASVLAIDDPDIRASMLSLLPKEIRRGDMLLAVEIRCIGPARFMVILTDITEERRVMAQLELEQRHLKLIVSAISDNRNFFEILDTFREFLARLNRIPHDGEAQSQDVRELYRETHTFKGLLGQFSFPATPQELHEAETRLSRLLSGAAAPTERSVDACFDLERIRSAFDADLAILTDALGGEFLAHGRTLVLSEEQARELEALSLRLLRGEVVDTSVTEVRRLLDEILCLRKVRLADALRGFDRLVQQVALRLDKQVQALVIHGDADIWIDPQVYKPFLQALVHVFRNAVIHGLETPEGRWEHDKPEAGAIICMMSSDGVQLRLTIADDGAGLDLSRLREKAAAAGVPDAADLNDEAAANLVFMDNVSTKDAVTDLAGRGVGLAAVRSETERLGGRVEVHSTAGQGTEFRFVLPLSREEAKPVVTNVLPEIQRVMSSALDRTCEYLAAEFGIQADLLPPQAGDADTLTLRDTTAIIGVGGTIDLFIAFSFEDELLQALFERMTEGMTIAPDEVERFKRDAAGEVVNIVVGHCTADLQERNEQGIAITPPMVLARVKTIPRLRNAMFHQRRMMTPFGAMDVDLVGPRVLFTDSLDYAD